MTSSIPPAAAEHWQEYCPLGAGFRIELPGEPRVDGPHRSIWSHGIAVSTTIAEMVLGERQFVFSHSLFDNVLGDSETMLMVARETLLKDESRVLREERTLDIDDVNVMRLVIDLPTENAVVVVLAAFVGREMYRAIYVGPTGTEASSDALRFLDSLRMIPR